MRIMPLPSFAIKNASLLGMGLTLLAAIPAQAGYELRQALVGLPVNKTPCTAPWGGTIPHRGTATAYTSATVPYGESCSSVATTLSCRKGVLSGIGPHQSCSVLPGCSSPGSQVYATAGSYTFTLPANCAVATLTAKAWGAGGGGYRGTTTFVVTNGLGSGSAGGAGGPGGYATSGQELAAGSAVSVIVGGPGHEFGGGGASAVVVGGTPLVVAGAGGAGGGYHMAGGYADWSNGTPGGSPSSSLVTTGESQTPSSYNGGSSAWGAGGTGRTYGYGTGVGATTVYSGGGGGGYKGGVKQSFAAGGGSSYAADGGSTIAGTLSSARWPNDNRRADITISVGGSNQEGYAFPAGMPGSAGRVVLTWQ